MQVERGSTGHQLMTQLNGLRMLDGNQEAHGLRKVRVVIATLSALALITTGLMYWVANETHGAADTTECAHVYPLPVCAEDGNCLWDHQSCTYRMIER